MPGCAVGARAGGKCIAHGGGRRCQHEGCGKGASGATDFCISHGGGDACAVAGCERARAVRGLCGYHSGRNAKKELCVTPGCRRKAIGDGRCRVHGGVRVCTHETCRNRARARGVCAKHDERREQHTHDRGAGRLLLRFEIWIRLPNSDLVARWQGKVRCDGLISSWLSTR